MNPSWNQELPEEVLLERCTVRGRAIISELQRVLTLTQDRQTVSAIAGALGVSRDRVRYLQHVLELRNGRGAEDQGLGRYPRPSPHGDMHTNQAPKAFASKKG